MLQDRFRDGVERRFWMAWISEESFEDLRSFLSFSREAESLHEIPRLVRDLVATFLQKRRSLNSGLLCGQSKPVEHRHRP